MSEPDAVDPRTATPGADDAPRYAPGPSQAPPAAWSSQRPWAWAAGEPPAAEAAEPPARPPRRRGLATALTIALVAVVGLAVAVTLLASARGSWEGQNADLRDRVGALTDEVSARNARIAELEQAEQQLTQLKEEYSAAVDARAQGTEAVQELEDFVAAYQECVDAQQEHFAILHDASRYTTSSVARAERSIVEFCDQVDAAYAEFAASRG